MARTIDPGTLRRRIQIHANTASDDDMGQAKTSYAAVDTVWGSVTAIRGDERFEASAISPQVTHRIVIRDYALTPKHLLVDDLDTTVKWHIYAILPMDAEGAEYLEVLVTERVGDT